MGIIMLMLMLMLMLIYLSPPAIAVFSLFWFLLPVRPRRERKPEWLILILDFDLRFRS